MIQNSIPKLRNTVQNSQLKTWLVGLLLLALSSCNQPKEDVVFRQVRNIVVEAEKEPMLRAQAVLYNPNDVKMKLRKIDIVIFVDGKNSAHIDQKIQLTVPAKDEFIVPLEAKLNLKEMGFLDTIFGIIGGKKMKIEYKGSISITYKGVPIKVPVKYQSEIRVRL
jgi:LEA14-like dessication related protein